MKRKKARAVERLNSKEAATGVVSWKEQCGERRRKVKTTDVRQ